MYIVCAIAQDIRGVVQPPELNGSRAASLATVSTSWPDPTTSTHCTFGTSPTGLWSRYSLDKRERPYLMLP